MSGPKVVRIVTREESEAICRGMLARIDAALEQWTLTGRLHDTIDDAAIAASRRRRDSLSTLVSQGRFADVQGQAPAEEAFLRADMATRLAQATAAKAVARTHARRRVEAAATLLRTLREAGIEIGAETVQGLERGDDGALAEGFRALSIGRASPATSSGLANKLRIGEMPTSFADWLASQPAPEVDLEIAKIEARLDELATLDVAANVDGLRARLEEVRVAQPSRRSLILDGLEVETGRLLTDARKTAELLSALHLRVAELEEATLPHDAFAVTAATSILDLERMLEAADRALAEQIGKAAAASRRAAVMKGLAGLGYEVREGMTTTLARSGKLVVADSARPGYGVELSGSVDFRQMQMRPVALETSGQASDPSRDRDAETIWCGQVNELAKTLADGGGGLEIVRSLPIGVTPLKRITVAAWKEGERVELENSMVRKLR
ncbi:MULTISPECIES: hypothetical protein [Bosea]|uniref:Uncharacterized protein n=1 Tax=Bosea vaviloviae TaxID=1526658 RepID=A0A0N1F525_9HYPH|nr:hypothetical protein [Bosea vaviloviae]KPH80799.1 hypothetical protein AE618_11260 [Bosea vaviloviae]